MDITIRRYEPPDREALRRISCETALFERSNEFFEDSEILADILTIYFTDYEPESCLVACYDGKVIGYLIGTVSLPRMCRVFTFQVFPKLLCRAIRRKLFNRTKSVRLITGYLNSLLKGEFSTVDFTRDYPASFHINVEKPFRARQVGSRLVEEFLAYLKERGVRRVQVSVNSPEAKTFFEKNGFAVLVRSRRSYLRAFIRKDISNFVLGRKAGH